jgi:hypothetical protein
MFKKLTSILVMGVTITGCGFVFSHDSGSLTPHASSLSTGSNAGSTAASSLTRASGAATQVRLNALFPNPVALPSQTPIFTTANFSFLNSSGIFSALGSDQKPTTALAQIALRDQATTLCRSQVGTSSDLSTIFSSTDILMSGESLPTDPAELAGFQAARNIWLDAYTVSMPEVQSLIALYKTALTTMTTGNATLNAKRAVCEAAILAPQFWIGSPLPTDIIRKVALELGRRRPSFANEIGPYKAGTLTVKAFVESVQHEAGYLQAINDWHQDWLGLRNFFPGGDPRGSSKSSGNGGFSHGASVFNGLDFEIDAPVTGSGLTGNVLDPFEPPIAELCSQAGPAQAFDPRTTEIVWEQQDVLTYTNAGAIVPIPTSVIPAPPTSYNVASTFSNTGTDGWNVLGANIHVDGVTAFQQRLTALYFTSTGASDFYSVDRNASRALMAQTYTNATGLFNKLCTLAPVNTLSANDGGVSHWYVCNGVVLLPSFLRSQLATEYAAVAARQTATWATATDPNYNYYLEKKQLDTVLVCADKTSHAVTTNCSVANSQIIHVLTPISGIIAYSANHLYTPADPTSGATLPVHPANQSMRLWGAAYYPAAAAPTYYLAVNMYGGGDNSYTPLSSVLNTPAATGNYLRSPISWFAQTGPRTGNPYSPPNRLLRRYSPSGEQNGFSIATTWFSNTPVNVCNNVDRFYATCFYQGPSPMANYWGNWSANLLQLADADNTSLLTTDTVENYALLPNFQCGQPNANVLTGAPVSNAGLASAYGRGFAVNGDGSYGALTALNTVASIPGIGDNTNGPEATAMNQITYDVQNEPYHLLDYIVADDMDYRQLITANYTCGSSSFAQHYQTQGFYLPVAKSSIPGVGQVGGSCSVPNGDPNMVLITPQNIQLSSNLVRSPNSAAHAPIGYANRLALNTASTPTTVISYIAPCISVPGANPPTSCSSNASTNPTTVATIPERTMSGVLSMPAFISPVMPSDRTLASRYFIRLLCGDPAMFTPNAAQTQMQKQYVSGRSHLQANCISCHINLDPVASALSSNFQYYEGSGMPEMQGEFSAGGVGLFYNIVGIRAGGGAKGAGALFGEQVNGVAELGEAVANSTQFASCVVQTAFSHVMGRAPAVSDASFVQTETAKFQTNYKYNQLVEDIVTSASYTEKP